MTRITITSAVAALTLSLPSVAGAVGTVPDSSIPATTLSAAVHPDTCTLADAATLAGLLNLPQDSLIADAGTQVACISG